MFAQSIRCAATRVTDARSLGCATDLAHPGLFDRQVHIDLGEDAEDADHMITPEERLRVAMARQ